MRLGLQVTYFTYPNGPQELGDTFSLIAERAERAGLYSLWMMDHFFAQEIPGIPGQKDMLEGWSSLAFVAGRTNRIKLGTMITSVTYRYPGILIKTATTLDVLSHGRTYCGIGTGWHEEEHRGLGIPFPLMKERFERLEETLQLAHQMWSGNEKPFAGKYYQLAHPLNSPQAIQKPHPPIMVGGTGEKKTLRLVAQYGDACNFSARIGKKAIQHKLDVLRDHCASLGRPYEAIEKTTLDLLHITQDGRDGSLSPQAAIDYFGELAEMGIDHAIFCPVNIYDPELFEVLATRIVPAVEKIRPAGRV